jgi:hypothetical protein
MTQYALSGKLYRYRRPDFLVNLTDGEYQNAFEVFLATPTICPTWDKWAKLVSGVSETLKKYLKQVAFWYNPWFKYPGGASAEMRTFAWPSQLVQCVSPKDENEDKDEESDNDAPDDAEEMMRYLIRDLWKIVRDEPGFKDPELAHSIVSFFTRFRAFLL